MKGKKTSLNSSCEGVIVDSDYMAHKYEIEFADPVISKSKESWLKVDNVTSLTKEENERQNIANEQRCHGNYKRQRTH